MSVLDLCIAAVCSFASSVFLTHAQPVIQSEPFALHAPTASDLSWPRKWTSARTSIDDEAQCLTTQGCARGSLLGLLAHWRTLDRSGQIAAVNSWVNRFEYASDSRVWGVRDRWASLREFLGKGSGDCEDFAIAKFTLLIALGMAPDAMRLLIVNESRRGQLHAVLAVFHDGEWLLLDNMAADIRSDRVAMDYTPVMELSDTGVKYYAGVDPRTFIQPAARPQ